MDKENLKTKKNIFHGSTRPQRIIAWILTIALLVTMVNWGVVSQRRKELPVTDDVSLLNNREAANLLRPWEDRDIRQDEIFSKYMKAIDQAIKKGDYEEAEKVIEACQYLATDDNRKAMLLAQRGELAYAQGDYKDSLAFYETIKKLDQQAFTMADLYFTTGRCKLLLSDMAGAKRDCDKGISSLAKGQTGAELYVLRGTAQMYLKHYKAAIQDFQQAQKLGYGNSKELEEQMALCRSLSGGYVTTDKGHTIEMDEPSQLSLAYYALGMYEEAVKAYRVLLDKGSNYYTKPQIYACLAKCYIFLGQYDAAIDSVNAGRKFKDKKEAATLSALLATAHMAKGQYEDGAKEFQKAIEEGYEKPYELNSQTAACYYYAGIFREAVRYGKEGVKGAKKDTEAVLWVALSYYQMEDYKEAVSWLERAVKIEQPYCEKNELRRCLARSYLLLNDFKKVLKTSEPVLNTTEKIGATNKTETTDKTNADIHALRGAAYLSMSQYDKAVGEFYTAIDLGYSDPYELYRQATLCHFLLGEHEKAIASGQKAMEYGKNTGELYYWTGISYFSVGKYDEARESLTQAVKLDDTQKNVYFYLGVCQFSKGAYKEAIDSFTISEERNETKEKCVYNRALCYLQLEDYALAKKDLKASAEQTTEKQVAGDAAELLKKLEPVLGK
ncbi:MAG: tetratricopeptide repeat protein [Anaerovorax sp.]